MSGHGHVTPNADGSRARCGGPGVCAECSCEAGVAYSLPVATVATTWMPIPPLLSDEDVERIAQRVAELITPKRRKRARR